MGRKFVVWLVCIWLILQKRNLLSNGVTAGISTLFFKMTIEKYL